MSTITSAPTISQEELQARAPKELGFLRFPQALTHFAEREMRLRQLANNHAMRDYLLFIADVAHAQHEQLQTFPKVALPDADALKNAALLGQPPLPAAHWQRDPAWQAATRAIAQAVASKVPENARPVLEQLAQADSAWLEKQADLLLNGIMLGLDLGTAPIVAAGLQVYWTHMVLATNKLELPKSQAAAFGRIDNTSVCPCCGSPAVDSVVRMDTEVAGRRYLHCSLCGSEWHMVRVKCTHCESTKGLVFESLVAAEAEINEEEGQSITRAVVQAESCKECNHYLKILHADRDPMVEPVADDLASVTLDMLVSQEGQQRSGVNLMLLWGDPEAAEAEQPGA